MRYLALVVILGLALSACTDDEEPASPTASPTVARLDDRLEDAAATATARAGEERFNGAILGLYIAPSVDDWPADVRAEHERSVAPPCVNEPTMQGELDFMQPLELPDGWAPAGYLESTGQPEVIACNGRASGVKYEFARANDDGTPAEITVLRTTTRAEAFDTPATVVNARTLGARQAVVISPLVAGAPAQRSIVLFPEDFGMTMVHAFNIQEEDLIAVGNAVAKTSAPYWEVKPEGLAADRIARVCAEIPPDVMSHQAAFGFTPDQRTGYAAFSYFNESSNYTLVLYPGDATDDCVFDQGEQVAFGADPAVFEAAQQWLDTQRGEMIGECATRPGMAGVDPAKHDWCYYPPRMELAGKVVLTVGRAISDYVVELVMEQLPDAT